MDFNGVSIDENRSIEALMSMLNTALIQYSFNTRSMQVLRLGFLLNMTIESIWTSMG